MVWHFLNLIFFWALLLGFALLCQSHRTQSRFSGDMRFKNDNIYVDSRGGKSSGKLGGVNGHLGGNVGGMGMGGLATDGAAVPTQNMQDMNVGQADDTSKKLEPPPKRSDSSNSGSGEKEKAANALKKEKSSKPANIKSGLNSRTQGSSTGSVPADGASDIDNTLECPGPCTVALDRQLRYALQQYWLGNFAIAFDCACSALGHNFGSHNMAKAVMYAIANARDSNVNFSGNKIAVKSENGMVLNSDGSEVNSQSAVSGLGNVPKPSEAAPSVIPSWEILAPLPVGKLEIDADPSFDASTRRRAQYTFTAPEWRGEEGSWSMKAEALDPIRHVLSMPYNVSVYSELMPQAAIQWRTYYASAEPAGVVELRFGTAWSEIARGVSSSAAHEFQGWARTSTYAHASGTYGLFCQGVHTAYIVNDDQTRLLVGDVYGGGKIVTSVDLRVGPVAIVLPLRGSVGLQFYCQLTEHPIPASDALLLFPLRDVPHMLQLGIGASHHDAGVDTKSHGLLISSVFTLPVHNTQAHPLSLAFSVQAPSGLSGRFLIRRASVLYRSGPNDRREFRGTSSEWNLSQSPILEDIKSDSSTIVGPGQVLLVPLELVELPSEIGANPDLFEDNPNPRTFLPCRSDHPFIITVTPSRGMPQRSELSFQCRNRSQSFLTSYVDHDGSVAQSAVLLPLPVRQRSKVRENRSKSTENGSRRKQPERAAIPDGNIRAGSRFVPTSVEEAKEHEKNELLNTVRAQADAAAAANIKRGLGGDFADNTERNQQQSAIKEPRIPNEEKSVYNATLYPVLLSLHGTGSSALDQADSYKHIPLRGETQGSTASSRKRAGVEDTPVGDEYVFGVEGFWVVAPTRWGAHNWEAIGELSARHSIGAVQRIMARFPMYLPQVWPHEGIVAGHSMGAHGAWLLSVNDPDGSVCVSSTAGWLAKEHYSTSNAFFNLDVQNSFTPPGLRSILARASHEFHVDQFAGNLQGVDKVHIRVGSADQTTHPWFSRRMARLLVSAHQHNGTRLEEVPEKQHWWWDTVRVNDGGVMNDEVMRSFYRDCLTRSQNRQLRRDAITVMRKNSTRGTESAAADECVNEKSALENYSPNGNGRTSAPDLHLPADSSLKATSNITRRDYKERTPSTPENIKAEKAEVSQESINLGVNYAHESPCVTGNFIVQAVNLAHSRGACGVRILQQQQQLVKSSAKVTCSPLQRPTPPIDGYYPDDGNVPPDLKQRSEQSIPASASQYTREFASLTALRQQRCDVLTSNVLRLSIDLAELSDSPRVSYGHGGEFNRFAKLYVNGQQLDIHRGSIYNESVLELCWPASASWQNRVLLSNVSVCSHAIDRATEKSPGLQGPIRMSASRPLIVVYGTPRDSNTRVALRDLAIYIANSHAAAHGTFIRAITDLEYRTGGYAVSNGPATHNLILVGGPMHNKVMRALESDRSDEFGGMYSALLPVKFKSDAESPDGSSDPHIDSAGGPTDWFRIGPKVFDAETNSVMFAFPFTYGKDSVTSSSSLAVCISSSRAEGYMHMSRLAWPTVPPMVRAPFANYLPDFIVVDESIWAEGFGGVAMAGYWNTWWQFDETQSYVRDF